MPLLLPPCLLMLNSGGPKRFVRQQIPDEVLHNPALNEAIKVSGRTVDSVLFDINILQEAPERNSKLCVQKSRRVCILVCYRFCCVLQL